MSFNPRAPCGARLFFVRLLSSTTSFNPRAPCGARRRLFVGSSILLQFQSTRPMRGATRPISFALLSSKRFNPRAPCGARPCPSLQFRSWYSFNPRAPCGARHSPDPTYPHPAGFQSTRPMRGATATGTPISNAMTGFNPRAPCGARLCFVLEIRPVIRFQSTRPMRGATKQPSHGMIPVVVSIHAPHAGRDL